MLPQKFSNIEKITSQIGGEISTARVVASSLETRICSAAGALVTEVHTIVDNKLSKVRQGASSVIADVKSKVKDAKPKASSLLAGAESKISEALPKATSLIASKISDN